MAEAQGLPSGQEAHPQVEADVGTGGTALYPYLIARLVMTGSVSPVGESRTPFRLPWPGRVPSMRDRERGSRVGV